MPMVGLTNIWCRGYKKYLPAGCGSGVPFGATSTVKKRGEIMKINFNKLLLQNRFKLS
jgi:hypothetical protein